MRFNGKLFIVGWSMGVVKIVGLLNELNGDG